MCGIIGAIRLDGGILNALVEGLRVVEYRGYDSAGVAVIMDGEITIRKKQGRLENLESVLGDGALEPALVHTKLLKVQGVCAARHHTLWRDHRRWLGAA